MKRLVGTIVVRTCAAAAAAACLLPPGTALAQDAEPPIWTGTAGVGLSVTSGNSDTTNLSLSFDLTHDPRTRNVMKWTALYLRGSQEGNLTVNRTALAFRDEYTVSSRIFVFGQIDYLRDTFKLIDYLVSPTGGVGVKIVDTEPTTFSVSGGAGVVWEKNPGFDRQTSGALTAGETLEHELTGTTTLKQAVNGLWKTDDLDDALYTFSIGVGTTVTERIQLSVELLDTFKTRPPTPETQKNDVALVTAVTATF